MDREETVVPVTGGSPRVAGADVVVVAVGWLRPVVVDVGFVRDCVVSIVQRPVSIARIVLSVAERVLPVSCRIAA